MTIEDKIDKYFISPIISLGSEPANHLLHLYADYIEIISLFSNRNFCTTSTILDRFIDEGIIVKGKDRDRDQAAYNDKNEIWIKQIFSIITDRSILYGSEYPFEVSTESVRLKEIDVLNSKNHVYLFLLLASSLNIFKDFQSNLTSDFERLSYFILSNFLPNGNIRSFGSDSTYEGNAAEKITQLSKELKVNLNSDFLKFIPQKNNKERGLDLLGWISFGDNVSNFLSILCQCACGKEWYKKLHETRRFEKYYKYHCNNPIHALFIPYSLINYQDSDFYESDELSVDTLLFERKRILNFLLDDNVFNDFDSKKIIDKCINFEEDIV